MAAHLLDSNLIIYASKPNGERIREFIAREAPFVSVISKVETLGYHALSDNERERLEQFFTAAPILSVSDDIVDIAIKLRQMSVMSLGDSLIAATALSFDLTLATHNVRDFDQIEGLTVVDPVESASF